MTKEEITRLMNYNSPEVLADSLFVPNPHEFITIRGAREHNLKNVSIVLPKNKLVVFSGLSGSGKSSLVFDTIYAEGQRRYVESLSSYARQFLGVKDKPDLDSIDGLSPAISIDQKSTANNPRSTVGTITEIYDYLRLLYAKIGKQHCAVCGANISGESITSMIERLMNLGKKTSNSHEKLENLKGKRRSKKKIGENNDDSISMQITQYDTLEENETEEIEIIMLAPIVTDQKGWHRQHLLDAKKNNFRRVRIDGQIMLLEEAEKLELNKQQKHSIEIVIDRLTISPDNKNRLVDSLETCLKFGLNKCLVVYYEGEIEQKLHLSKDKSCPNGHGTPGDLAPRMFSFNSPHGACPVCTGLGVITEIDPRLVVPNENLSIMEGAIRPLSRMSLSGGWLTKMFETLSVKYNFKLDDPWCKLDEKIQKIIFYGDDKFEGVITNLKRRYRESTSDASRRDIESYMTKHCCPNCGGARLKPESLAVTVAGQNIAKIVKLSINQGINWFESLQNNSKTGQISTNHLSKVNSKNLIQNNSQSLENNLSANLSNNQIQITESILKLTQILWDFNKLNQKLEQSYDLAIIGGSSDISVAKFVAKLYKDGIVKKLIFSGNFSKSQNWPKTEAETFANIAIDLGVPKNDILVETKAVNTGENITLSQKIIMDKKLKANKILLIHKPYVERRFLATFEAQWTGKCEVQVASESITLENYLERIEKENTQTKQEVIEKIVANTFKMEKYAKLGFQSPQKIPTKIQKALEELIKLSFDRYLDQDSKIIETKTDSKSIQTNEQNTETSFKLSPKDQEISKMILKEIIIRLQFLQNVGLKYLNLGRSADTLSGGEAQRIRLATQIGSGLTGVLYILDEPSIGLHQRDNDKLLGTLERLRDLGNTVIVVEHDEDTMRKADFLVDIGPRAGKMGGNIVGIGTPEMVIKDPNSPTGRFLAGTEIIETPKNRRPVNIKSTKIVPRSQQIAEIKEDWMLEIAKIVGK